MADTIERLDDKFARYPMMRATSEPSDAEIEEASQQIGIPFVDDYRQFLLRYGGAMVGANPVFGLRPVEVMDEDTWSVVDVTHWFRSTKVPGCDSWAVVSVDHGGNPIGMDRFGAIWIHDQVFGGLSPLARSFEEYIRVWCLKLPRVGDQDPE